jgi:hypothetical protein
MDRALSIDDRHIAGEPADFSRIQRSGIARYRTDALQQPGPRSKSSAAAPYPVLFKAEESRRHRSSSILRTG